MHARCLIARVPRQLPSPAFAPSPYPIINHQGRSNRVSVWRCNVQHKHCSIWAMQGACTACKRIRRMECSTIAAWVECAAQLRPSVLGLCNSFCGRRCWASCRQGCLRNISPLSKHPHSVLALLARLPDPAVLPYGCNPLWELILALACMHHTAAPTMSVMCWAGRSTPQTTKIPPRTARDVCV